jgi:hypothetical protein
MLNSKNIFAENDGGPGQHFKFSPFLNQNIR